MKHWSPRARQTAFAVAIVIVVQGLAVLGYRALRERKHAGAPRAFEMQTLGGELAPAIELERADGKRIRLQDLRGKPVLVHFWASWCTPCREEIPTLLALARNRHDDLHVLAISLDDAWPAVRLFFDGAIPEQVARPIDPQATHRYGVTKLPDTFLVSATGALVARAHGARDWLSNDATRFLGAQEIK